MSDSEPEIEKTLTDLRLLKSLIDNIEQHLKGLRTICAPNDEYTQKEIRVAEGKLVRYYSKQIIVKNKITSDNVPEILEEFPNTRQFLSVVGIPETAIKGVLAEDQMNLYTLLERSEADVKTLLLKYNASSEDARRLNLALRNLKICTERELSGGTTASGDSDVELHWTNSQSTSSSYGDFPARPSPRPSTSSQSSSDNSMTTGIPTQTHSTPPSPVTPSHNERLRSVGYTPPPTPPTVRTPKTKYPITPPPKKKILLFPEYPSMARSKSQESQLALKVQDIDPIRSGKKKQVKDLNLNSGALMGLSSSGGHDTLVFRRPSNELDPGGGGSGGGGSRGPSGPASPIITSPIQSPAFMHGGAPTDERLVVPKMKHQINHKFITKIMIGSNCDICSKNIIRGKCCRHCKFKCHKDCLNKVPPSCGLTDALLDGVMTGIMEGISQTRRPTTPNMPQTTPEILRTARSVPAFAGPDSSSASSSNSSNSSPVPPGMSSEGITSPSPYQSPRVQRSFQFPDVSESSSNITQTEPLSLWDRDLDRASTNNSDKTIVGSNASEITLERVDSEDSQDEPPGSSLTRINSLSLALKEWDIPYEELISEEPIGTGRFGTVHKGQWHGDVAIKTLNMDPDTDFAAQLSAFKLEVAMLRKTRHENLVLFMGACMKPPHLAIVTSLCRGSSLYTLLHVRKEKFPMSKAIIIAQQVSQGMGYLHAKGIIHKDLKTKNIFFDKDKVVITDFGLFNVTKLCHANRHADRLQIPPGWLCYLSPEIIQSLQAGAAYANTDLPFSEMSDVYAFGTVWYELLNGNWPFSEQPPESIIWQVGHGIKPSFGSIRGSKEVKDMLIVCWAYNPDDRPSFSQLLKIMERLPRKPFQRSPSHPTHLLSRSADSLHTS